MRLKKPMIAVSTVALLTLAACGGGSSSGPPGATASGNFTGGAAGAGQDPNRTAPAAEAAGVQKGGTLLVQTFGGLTTMDPTEAYYVDTGSILSAYVVRSLTQYVWDDQTKDMVLVPDLATDLGTPNSDYTEWTFTLRDGIKYENGQAVTPEDIKYGIERSFDRETFPGGATYSNDYFLDGDKYKGPYKSGSDYKGVVIDGNNITIKMARPFPDMPYWGAFAAMSPIPPGKDSDPATYRLHPWATGPYKFDQYTPNKSLTLVKNDQWDPNTDPGRHQYLDEIDFNFNTPQAKTEQTLLSDNGDAANTLTYNNVTTTNYGSFAGSDTNQLVTGSSPCTAMWMMDMRKIKDKDVREALAWAYPYKDVYAASGLITNVTSIPGTNVMPPGIQGREDYEAPPGHQPGQTDPAKAKALLEKANAVGYEIKFLYRTDDPLNVAGKDQIVKGLEKAGFKATPVATTLAQYADVRADPNTDINVRAYGWCSDWPSGATWIPPLFHSTDIKNVGFEANQMGFNEPSVDKQIDQILASPVEEQPAAWNKLGQDIQEKWFPFFVTYYYGVAMIRGTNVQGMNDDPVFGMPTWKDIWLKQS